MLACTLLGACVGDAICGSIVPVLCWPFPPFVTGPLGSLIGLEVGGSVGSSVGAAGALMIGLSEGLCVALGGLDVVLGAATSGFFQICGGLINVCNAIL